MDATTQAELNRLRAENERHARRPIGRDLPAVAKLIDILELADCQGRALYRDIYGRYVVVIGQWLFQELGDYDRIDVQRVCYFSKQDAAEAAFYNYVVPGGDRC